MRRAYDRRLLAFLPLLLIIVVAGCTSSPTAPLPSTTGPNLSPQTVAPSISGMVIDPNGGCIRGATVEAIAGQAVGQKVVQTGECDYWSYGGGGFTLKDLTPGVLMTLRASAPGFVTKDISNVAPGQADIVIELKQLSVQ